MQNQIGYAVVGLGHISQRSVLPAFQHAQRSRLVSLVSGDAEKAKRLAREFGAKSCFPYNAFDRCLQDPEVQAVYIATPNSAHLQFALAAAAAGKHVLCEKPLAHTEDECRQIVQACARHGVKLMTGYRKRFESAAIELKRLIMSGALGKLRIIHTAFTISLPSGPSWHLELRRSGGGSLLDVGIYCVNTVRWLTRQEPVEATAYSWTTDPERFGEVDENIAFQLRFPDGLYMQASSSFTAAKVSFLNVYGESGWASLNPAYAYNEERRLLAKIGNQWLEKKFEVMDEFRLELDHLSECIETDRDPRPSGVSGWRDVFILQAIYSAAKTGRPVPIHLPI